jgi:molybdenum cofactor cytidylyltransferase
MITLVDRPPVSQATLEALRAAFQAALSNGKWALVPEYRGKHGHPILVGREMIEAFLKAPSDSTGRDVLHQNLPHLAYISMDDPGIAMNVDTPEDYRALAGPGVPG